MQLPERFRLTLIGRISAIRSRQNAVANLAHYLSHILIGGDFDDGLLQGWGISAQAEASDPGDDKEATDICNLYRMRGSVAEIAMVFAADVSGPIEWKDDIYPRYAAPVIVPAHGLRRLGPMTWGFPTEVAGARGGKIKKHVTNARNLASPMWRPSMAKRRCMVLFTQFAEPKPGKDADGKPAQHWFRVTGSPVAAFAGLWRPTEAGPVFAFCTIRWSRRFIPRRCPLSCSLRAMTHGCSANLMRRWHWSRPNRHK